MRKFLAYFKLRTIMFLNDTTAIFFSYILPILMIVGFGFFFMQNGNEKIKFYYNPQSLNDIQKNWIEDLKKNPLLDIKETPLSINDARKTVEKGDMETLLVFNDSDENRPFNLYYNRNSNQSEINIIALNKIIQSVVHGETNSTQNINSYFKKTNSYIYVIFPGAIGLVLWIIAMLGTGNVVIEERQFGVIKKLKTLDSRPISYIFSIFLTRVLIALSLMYILIPIVYFLFGIKNEGSLILLSSIIVIGTICFLGLSVFLANISSTPDAYNGFVQIAQLPVIILGGIFFSIEVFPHWLQIIANLSPLTAFVSCFKTIFYEGIKLYQIGMIMNNLIILSIWAIMFSVLGTLTFKWK